MQDFNKLLEVDLQLCAEGAGGADGGSAADGAAGAMAADAGQQNSGVQPAGSQEQAGSADAGQIETDPGKAFEQLIKGQYKDQYNARVESAVKGRLKAPLQELQRYKTAQPIFDILAQKYGVDPTDLEALTKAAQEDASFFAEEAMARGVDPKDLMGMKRMEREHAAMKRQLEQQQSKEQADRQFALWSRQAEEAKARYPGFDIHAELKNKDFERLLRSGVPVRTAYEVIHNDEILHGAMQFAAQKAAQNVTDTVIAGAARPAENGTGAQGAVSPKIDPKKLTDKEIMDLRNQARKGARITLT